MTRLGQPHWLLAFILALAIHLVAYWSTITLPGSEQVYRGGGTFDQSGPPTPGASGVFVQLGNSGESAGATPEAAALKEQAAPQVPQELLAQAFIAGDDKPGSGKTEPSNEDTKVPASKKAPEPSTNPPADKVGQAPQESKSPEISDSKVAAPPKPKRKPKPPDLLPELETFGRRHSVQGPSETPKTAPKPKPDAPAASKAGKAVPPGSAKGAEKAGEADASSLAFVNTGKRAGTASGNEAGEIRELNYEDQVLLWLKRHGSYPYEASMYQLEDTVTLKFAINRSGKILYHYLVKKSQYSLLNNAVDRMMERSSPVPPIPADIKKNEMTFTIPVHFDPHVRR